MLTLKKLKEMKPGIFATGTTTDDQNGINMTGSGKALRWVATRGTIHDWTIYIHEAFFNEQYIKDCGDKVHNKKTVEKLVPCDSKALEMYRQ